MATIKIKDYLTSSMAVSTDKADTIYKDLKSHLINNEDIHLDFDGIKLVITAFLNIIFGKLYGIEGYSEEFIDNKIHFLNTSESIQEMIEDVRKNSKRYYSDRTKGSKRNDFLNNSIDGNN